MLRLSRISWKYTLTWLSVRVLTVPPRLLSSRWQRFTVKIIGAPTFNANRVRTSTLFRSLYDILALLPSIYLYLTRLTPQTICIGDMNVETPSEKASLALFFLISIHKQIHCLPKGTSSGDLIDRFHKDFVLLLVHVADYISMLKISVPNWGCKIVISGILSPLIRDWCGLVEVANGYCLDPTHRHTIFPHKLKT